jgi:hypothetical protein
VDILHFGSFRQMLEAVGLEAAVPDVYTLNEGVSVYHQFNNYEQLAAEHGVVAFVLGEVPPPVQMNTAEQLLKPHPRQAQYECHLKADIDRAWAVQDATNEAETDLARDACWKSNKIQICEGPLVFTMI